MKHMNKFNLKFSRVYSNSMFVKNLYSLPKFNYTSTANSGSAESINKNKSNEINVKSDEKNYHYPIRGFPKFENGLYTVFKYQPSERLPLIPYEIKECAMKGVLIYFLFNMGRKSSRKHSGCKHFSRSFYTMVHRRYFRLSIRKSR